MQLNIVTDQPSTNLSLGVSEERHNELGKTMAELVGNFLLTNMRAAKKFADSHSEDEIINHLIKEDIRTIPEGCRLSSLCSSIAEKCDTLGEYTLCITRVQTLLDEGAKTLMTLDKIERMASSN